MDSSAARQRVARNATALLAMQAATFLSPLIAAPYLARTIGIELYGVVGFGTALAGVAAIVTDYGFTLSATNETALNRDNRRRLEELLGAVYLFQLLLAVVCAIALITFALTTVRYAPYSTYFLLLTASIFGQACLPVWFFQGIEQMAYIAVFSVLARVSYVVTLLLFVRSPNDYVFVSLLNGLSWGAAAVLALFMVLRLGYRPRLPRPATAFRIAAESTPFFWSRAAVATYTAGGIIFLGLVSNHHEVALYAAAQQFFNAGLALLNPLVQALYPHMARERDLALLRRVLRYATLVGVIGVAGAVLAGKQMLTIVFGSDFADAHATLIAFAIVYALSVPAILYGYPLFAALGNPGRANRSVYLGGATQVAALCFLATRPVVSAELVASGLILVQLVVLWDRLRGARQLSVHPVGPVAQGHPDNQ